MLIFLKLGGSIITHKNRPHTARYRLLNQLSAEIVQARQQIPDLQLVIGHGSGSFGHVAGKKYNTRQGVHTPEQWLGFAEVWKQARDLNQIVVEALSKANLPLIAFPPSASVISSNGKVLTWDVAPIQSALQAGLVPLINGDTIIDHELGGTILSTEELFVYLASHLHPQRLLLAGLEEGVWKDFPHRQKIIPVITPAIFDQMTSSLKGSAAVDVTGGMYEKVASMIQLVTQETNLQVSIFSGLIPGKLYQALSGNFPGTLIQN
jgi:isopentenyl phosphate kinase